MAQQGLRPQIKISYGRQNEPLRVPISDLLINPQAKTFITTDSIVGLSVLTVKDIQNLRNNQILFIGQEGNQGSEIKKTHATTAPSGSTVTLASTTTYPHSASTGVILIPYDQVEFSYSETSTGSKTVLITTNISAGLLETPYIVSTYSTGFFFARWKETVGNTFSSYSDATPVAGYTKLMARSIIDSALSDINKDGANKTDVLSDSYAFQQIDNCQTEVLREMKRLSFMQSFNQVVTNALVGAIRAPLPADCDDQNTNTSVWNFRLGTNPNMTWVDKTKYDEMTYSMAQTTASTGGAVGATSVVLTDSSDFEDTGSFYHRGNATSVAYIANDKSTGTLTVSALTTAVVAGVEVYQNPLLGLPRYWTAFGGFAYHWPLVGSTYRDRNYLMDFYKAQTTITTDTDEIVLPDPTIVQYYLEWKFLKKLANGAETEGSLSSKINYENRKQLLKIKDNPNRLFRMKPRLNKFNMDGSDTSNRSDRLRGFD